MGTTRIPRSEWTSGDKKYRWQKNVKKYSIWDSQDAFIKRLDDCQSAENYIKELKLQGKPIQPFLIIVSPHIGKCGDTYIYFDKVDTPLRVSHVLWIFYLKYFTYLI